MTFSEQINDDIKKAMLAKDSVKLNALRAVKAALLLAKTEGGASSEPNEQTITALLQKMVKQRKDSIAVYEAQNRPDLADEEKAQLAFIEVYLPEQMSSEQLKKEISDIIAETGASGIKDMGKVMGAASKKLAGKADNKSISAMVKEILGIS